MAEEDRTPFLYCAICGGPVYYGEPIIGCDLPGGKIGWAHRMKTWCDAFRESVARGDQKICADMGIKLDE